jgi:transcription elongation GreA/GreB family factor
MIPDKQVLLRQLIEQLEARLAGFDKSAREAHAEATHEQNKAENKYDTRAIEASYLAEGQARQAAEVAASIQVLEGMPLHDFGPGTPIAPGALVRVEGNGEVDWYFLAPCAGGAELISAGIPVLVLTPQSPLGGALSGLKKGGRFKLQLGRERVAYVVGAVH